MRTSEEYVGAEHMAQNYKSNIIIGDSYYHAGKGKYSDQCIEDESKSQFAIDALNTFVFQLDKLEAVPVR